MESLQLNCLVHHYSIFTKKPPLLPRPRRWRILAVAKTSGPGNELSAQDIFELFLRERQASGDFISKTSDVLWKKEVLDVDEDKKSEAKEKLQQLRKMTEDESGGGFLKLSQTRKWAFGNDAAPANDIVSAAKWETDGENRRRISFLEYEALKRELMLITIGIAVACSGYCFLTFSPQVALSYVAGAICSCLYLQLLYHHADNISKDKVAEIFIPKRVKKIGIRSDDLKDLFEKTVRGSALALSSPRLVIPAAVFGFWALLKHYFGDSSNFEMAFIFMSALMHFDVLLTACSSSSWIVCIQRCSIGSGLSGQ